MELLKPNYINVVGLGGWRTLLDRRGIGMIFSKSPLDRIKKLSKVYYPNRQIHYTSFLKI